MPELQSQSSLPSDSPPVASAPLSPAASPASVGAAVLAAPASMSHHLAGLKVHLEDGLSCGSSRNMVRRYEEFMMRHGATRADSAGEADIVLIDTCAFNHQAESNSLSLIERSQAAAKPDARVIVSGCLASINPQKLQERFKGQYFSPRNEKHLAMILGIDGDEANFLTPYEVRSRFTSDQFKAADLKSRLQIAFRRWLLRRRDALHLDGIPFFHRTLSLSQGLDPQTYSVTVSQGCMGACAFCSIPLAKGRTTSVPIGLIVEDIRARVEQGVRHIFLTSEDTGAYGQDIKSSIVDLLNRIHDIPGEFYLYIQFFDPRWLRQYRDGLFEVFARGRIRYMQLPLQSGSNSVLRRMRRAYQMEHVLPVVREMRRLFPRMHLTSEFIAGFPGETEAEFLESQAVVREGLFSRINIFEFSQRPGAATAEMPDHLPADLVRSRARRLRRAQPLLDRLLY